MYTMDHPDLTVSYFMGNAIGLKRAKEAVMQMQQVPESRNLTYNIDQVPLFSNLNLPTNTRHHIMPKSTCEQSLLQLAVF